MDKRELLRTLAGKIGFADNVDILNAVIDAANKDGILDYYDLSEAFEKVLSNG